MQEPQREIRHNMNGRDSTGNGETLHGRSAQRPASAAGGLMIALAAACKPGQPAHLIRFATSRALS
jgi:hypothetical protein